MDFDAWQAQLAEARDGMRAAAEAELGAHRGRLEKAVRREGKLRERWLKAMDHGDDAAEKQAAEAHQHVIAERDDARAAIDRLEVALDTEQAPATDALLDAWNSLRDAIRLGGSSLGELNERLRAEFEEFRLDLTDNGVVEVFPILRERPGVSPTLGVSYDEAMARPLPSQADYEQMQREEGRADPFSVTGEERIRPPAKALAVPDQIGPYSQEYRPIWSGLALPPLLVETAAC